MIKSTSIFATVDLGKSIDLDVRVKTGTAAQAVECEKSLGVLLGLIQDEVVADGLKSIEADAAKNPIFKDMASLLKAVGTAARDAKFSTLGNEARVTASIPTDLPFTGAYLAAKQKVQEAAAARRVDQQPEADRPRDAQLPRHHRQHSRPPRRATRPASRC